MNILSKKAFTLVELIVVITILAILSTIAFISLSGYSKEARDSKRISDTRNLLTKINVEQTKGKPLSELIINTRTESGKILGVSNSLINTFGVSNFDALKEDAKAFKDPSIKTQDYPVAYAVGGTGSGAYKFFEIATISEKENTTKIIGNYYKLELDDEESLFLTGGLAYKEGSTPIYNANGGVVETPVETPVVTYSCQNPSGVIVTNSIVSNEDSLTSNIDLQNTNSGGLCYYECKATYSGTKCDNRVVFGDEDTEAITACNKWVQDNVGTKGGGYQNWLWVPASKFTKDGITGIGMDDNYYKRTLTYTETNGNNINYTCNGFAVAKYEMTYEDATTPNSTGGGTDWNTYSYTTSKIAISREDRYPIVDITQTQALTACNGIGTGFHLITNNEWMTVARNIELRADNWSSGTIGSGYISNGLSAEQTMGCTGTNTKATYTSLPRTRASKTGVGTGIGTNTTCDIKRQLTLSNNEKIWDLSGNIWEHVNKGNSPTNGANYNSASIRVSNACGGSNWYSFSGNDGYGQCGYLNGYTYSNIGPLTSGLNANNGIGRIYSYSTVNNVFLRGGSSSYDAAYTGLFMLYLSRSDTYRHRHVGFRCSL